jgi:hypothetical protein
MRTITRTGFLLLVACAFSLASAPAAWAQADEDQGDTVVVLTGRAEVRGDESVDNVFVADGPAVIDGRVENGVVSLNGDVLIRGVVEDNVVAPDGQIVITETGRLEGDAVSRHRPEVEAGGRFEGDWERWNPRAWSRGAAIFTRVALWIAFTVSTLALGLLLGWLVPRAPAAVDEAARERLGPVIGWGVLLTIGLPVAALIVMATLVGLPLGLGTLFALGLVYGIGYTAAAWLLGRRVAPRARPILSFLAGWGILRVLALIPILGGLSWFVAIVVGLGAVAVAAYRARGRAPVPAAPAPAPPPPAPTAP